MAQNIDYNPNNITFGKLTEADLPLMHKWLHTPEVSKWYKQNGKTWNPSFEQVGEKWMPRIAGAVPVSSYIILYGEKPIGYIHSYRMDDHPDTKRAYEQGEDTAGIDLFIGEEEYLHRGLGSFIISKFLNERVFPIYSVMACVIDPEPENKIAIKAYEKVGFRYVKTVWNPHEKQWAYIMVFGRENSSRSGSETSMGA